LNDGLLCKHMSFCIAIFASFILAIFSVTVHVLNLPSLIPCGRLVGPGRCSIVYWFYSVLQCQTALCLLPRSSSLWAEETCFLPVYTFLRILQQPNPFCCDRSTTNLFMISFLSRTLDSFFFFLSLRIYLWLAETSQQPISQTTWLKVTIVMDLFVVGRDQSAADQPNDLAEGHPPL